MISKIMYQREFDSKTQNKQNQKQTIVLGQMTIEMRTKKRKIELRNKKVQVKKKDRMVVDESEKQEMIMKDGIGVKQEKMPNVIVLQGSSGQKYNLKQQVKQSIEQFQVNLRQKEIITQNFKGLLKKVREIMPVSQLDILSITKSVQRKDQSPRKKNEDKKAKAMKIETKVRIPFSQDSIQNEFKKIVSKVTKKLGKTKYIKSIEKQKKEQGEQFLNLESEVKNYQLKLQQYAYKIEVVHLQKEYMHKASFQLNECLLKWQRFEKHQVIVSDEKDSKISQKWEFAQNNQFQHKLQVQHSSNHNPVYDGGLEQYQNKLKIQELQRQHFQCDLQRTELKLIYLRALKAAENFLPLIIEYDYAQISQMRSINEIQQADNGLPTSIKQLDDKLARLRHRQHNQYRKPKTCNQINSFFQEQHEKIANNWQKKIKVVNIHKDYLNKIIKKLEKYYQQYKFKFSQQMLQNARSNYEKNNQSQQQFIKNEKSMSHSQKKTLQKFKQQKLKYQQSDQSVYDQRNDGISNEINELFLSVKQSQLKRNKLRLYYQKLLFKAKSQCVPLIEDEIDQIELMMQNNEAIKIFISKQQIDHQLKLIGDIQNYRFQHEMKKEYNQTKRLLDQSSQRKNQQARKKQFHKFNSKLRFISYQTSFLQNSIHYLNTYMYKWEKLNSYSPFQREPETNKKLNLKLQKMVHPS